MVLPVTNADATDSTAALVNATANIAIEGGSSGSSSGGSSSGGNERRNLAYGREPVQWAVLQFQQPVYCPLGMYLLPPIPFLLP